MTPTPAQLLAGAHDRHGEHERFDQGWDQVLRRRYVAAIGLDADADTYGRHAAREPVTT